jgi:hypothetical protein
MYAFTRRVRKADQIRRFTIQPAATGWEVKEEQDNTIVRERRYQDWHRVEQARRAMVIELRQLTENGWSEVSDERPAANDARPAANDQRSATSDEPRYSTNR